MLVSREVTTTCWLRGKRVRDAHRPRLVLRTLILSVACPFLLLTAVAGRHEALGIAVAVLTRFGVTAAVIAMMVIHGAE